MGFQMPFQQPTLHLLCGLAASGKSTLATHLGGAPGTVFLAEDAWLATLYADQMSSIQDYVRCAARLEAVIGPHVTALLVAGVSVVLDFQANTLARRRWMRGLAWAAGARVVLHHLDLPEDVCRARLKLRNARGDHPFTVSDEQFTLLARHFVPPSPDEGFEIERHGDGDTSPA